MKSYFNHLILTGIELDFEIDVGVDALLGNLLRVRANPLYG